MARTLAADKDAISVLASLLRSTEEPCPLILLGAGASFRSGVPTAAEAVRQIARLVYSERELMNARPPARVKPSEWESWLHGFDWFALGNDRLAENFPLVVENLLVPNLVFLCAILSGCAAPRSGLSERACRSLGAERYALSGMSRICLLADMSRGGMSILAPIFRHRFRLDRAEPRTSVNARVSYLRSPR